ncbi:MAG: DUF885 domain-containing protein [Gammaproteobacteria bacterium]|nr:DUF885 domain-containing protein [Gammaproteobacteria bacterium]MDH5736129.1 DUF885 domain-containing protein [Gammaproteobacteria bacterium]
MSDLSPQQAFHALLDQYYHAWFRYHPEQAVHVGVAGYEEFLRAYSDDDIGALISLNEKLISSLDELDFYALDAESQIDYSVLYNAAIIELHDLLEHDWRYRRPQDFLPVDAIHQLISRPVDNLHQAFKRRLQQIPEYLRGARAYLSQQPALIPADWLNSACQQAKAGVIYFRDLVRHPEVVSKFQNPARLQPLCEAAAGAMDDFLRFLEQELKPKATGEFASGQHYFERLVKHNHFLDVSADDLHAFGQSLFDSTQKQLLELTREMRGDDDIQAVLARIRQDHPDSGADALLTAYRASMKSAYDFITQHELVSVPEKQMLKVMETPIFLRHEIPFAAYEEPASRDESQQGYYYVTPVVSGDQMLEHNWTSIDLTCVHEAFPGHHLQFVTANQNSSNSLPRLLNPSATLYEGWALYCEDLMLEQGYLDRPEHKFIMLRDRLWRALRVMLDVELHTRGLSAEDAAQRMCDSLGFDLDQCRADISWYIQSPTVPMGYATGWALIRAVREIESKQSDFNLKDFHNRLLSVGSCALPLVIKRAFGDATWQEARQQVFGR